jgi:hypothetical protein
MGVFRGLSPLKGGLGVSPRFKFPLPGLGRGPGGWSKTELSDSLDEAILWEWERESKL